MTKPAENLQHQAAVAPTPAGAAPGKILPPAAERALAEAARRRAAIDARAAAIARTKEIDGRKGPEPVRYDDWEVNGIASDF
ncbi:DUF1674 domain-containing protein [Chelatococcus sp. SYSU_G07232]|uniref:DUF1674 domain-containing protein n=1 Tax=Chelatococcus albus TaxID=3047466 RepID=A0ABT7ALT9_9HYPH|nr:succinate dehydrogenase assembly factor 4 [Chelatococcus sp. SYSU_G07232]MDJ1159774.1 DUF1674 domain-containing protein [Chelatococcus sp. SYSU_G07232]